MKKRIIATLSVLALLLSFSVSAYAASFSDLAGHWAKEYMEDLADRGYLSGYEDGTIRPNNSITACETLALLSRFYKLDDEASKNIYSDYGAYVENTVPGSVSWAYDELAVCLAAGIITKDELKSITLTEAIKKEVLSLFLIRAMQLQAEAEEMANSIVAFKDAGDIDGKYLGSVAKLVSMGIVKGDDNNNFSPKSSVTRAVVATMVSRSLNQLKSLGKTPVIADYEGITRTFGIIAAADSDVIELRGFDGLKRVYSVPSSASVTVNGSAHALSSAYTGCYVEIRQKAGNITAVMIESDSNVKWVQGRIYSLYNYTVYLQDLETGDKSEYNVSSNISITHDGAEVALSGLAVKNFATLKLVDGVVKEVRSVSGNPKLKGSIAELTYGTTVTLKVRDSGGIVYRFNMAISNLPTILRGETKISIDRLSVGDEITVAMDNCSVDSISTEETANTLTGDVTSITTSINGIKWVLSKADGSSVTLSVEETAAVYSGTTSISLSAIKPGDTVNVTYYGSTITEIHLESAASSVKKISGKVLLVDASTKTITILSPAGKLIYISASSAGSIITANTGSSISIGAIKADSNLVAYGSYSSSSKFAASSIIIEE